MTNYINIPVIAGLAYCFAYGCTNGPSDGDKLTKQKSETLVSNSMEYNSCQTSDDYKQHTINMYSLAIRDYIKLVKDEYNFTFDTLYLGRHSHGNPTDFPDIELPATIDGTAIFTFYLSLSFFTLAYKSKTTSSIVIGIILMVISLIAYFFSTMLNIMSTSVDFLSVWWPLSVS